MHYHQPIQVFYGICAYDLERQNQLLSYLLRKGFKPKIVIYLDGLNDIATHARSRFIPDEKLVYHGWRSSALDSSYKLFVNQDTFMHRLMTKFNNLALFRLLRTRNKLVEKISPYGVSAFQDTVYSPELEDVLFHNGFFFSDFYKDTLIDGLLKSIKKHDDYAKGLAAGFDFDFYHFYQPIGLLHSNNMMNKSTIEDSYGYPYFTSAHQAILNSIKNREIKVHDASMWLEEKK